MQLPNMRKQLGQGMTEYIIIVALVAIAAIGSFKYFGQTARSQAAAATQELAGQDGTKQKTVTDAAAGKATNEGKAKSGMADFAKND
ncbi:MULTISPECIES: pilus assembly protein [unclassified Psychrobacter]|uniref:pilus assembly protein n=1 Tax=unclassified Psychrobacter TaxID=196806 RepID=UPI0018668329|nr:MULTISPECIES: pilus assembly protein [unclassified Psychrobacter]